MLWYSFSYLFEKKKKKQETMQWNDTEIVEHCSVKNMLKVACGVFDH